MDKININRGNFYNKKDKDKDKTDNIKDILEEFETDKIITDIKPKKVKVKNIKQYLNIISSV